MDVSFAAPLSALDAYALSQQVTANNVANMNTEEFRASRATMEDLPEQGGVAVQEVRETSALPPLVPSMRLAEEQGRVEQQQVDASGSTTDPAREMVNLTVNQRAFEANAAVVRARDEMVGTVLDISA